MNTMLVKLLAGTVVLPALSTDLVWGVACLLRKDRSCPWSNSTGIGVTYMVLLLPWFVKFVDIVVPGAMDYMAPDGTKPYIASHIAAGHSIFNIFNTIFLLPFSMILVRIAQWMVPEQRGGIKKHLHFIDYGFISVPTIAAGQAKQEIIRMANIVLEMFSALDKLLFQPALDRKLCDKIFTEENTVDNVHTEISRFLAYLLQNSSSREVTETVRRYIHVADEYESIADYCEMTAKYTLRKEVERIEFSEKAMEGLMDAHRSIHEYLEHCTKCFTLENEDLLIEAVTKSKSLQKLLKNLRREHIDRLNRKECGVMAGLLYTDILAAFNNIRTHAFDIVEATAGLK